MPSSQILTRHKLMLDRLRRSPATRDEILDYIAARMGADFEQEAGSRATFERDKRAMLRDYGIEIIYRASDGRYTLDDTGPENSGLRLLEAFDLMNLLRSRDELDGQVILDTRRPVGTEYFTTIVAAIRERRELRFDYFSYEQGRATARRVRPYALKEFRSRWYVLATGADDDILKTYGLDRITNLEASRKPFRRTLRFDAALEYRDYFGITRQHTGDVEEVELWFDRLQGAYIKSLPLHASQELLSDDASGIRIRLRLFITHDFVMELLSYGASMRVLAPVTLEQRIRDDLRAALAQYDDPAS